MKSKPILFSGPMVRAILAGTKTQTRRIIKPQPPAWCVYAGISEMTPPGQWEFRGPHNNQSAAKFIPCPYLPMSETTLWVRETHAIVPRTAYWHDRDIPHREHGYDWAIYREGWERSPPCKWRPSIHMPRWASRISLAIKSMRCQLLQDISEEDAIAEGVQSVSVKDVPRNAAWSARQDFSQLWDKINGKRPGCTWVANPWVWAVTFSRLG